MTSSGQISDLRGIKWNLYFWKAHDKSYPKIQFFSILDKYFKSYGNINAIWPLFGMGSSQIWPCHVTQAKNLSFPYLKSYCPLNFRKSHQISWFCCIPNGSYKEDNLKESRICTPPPPWGIGLSSFRSVGNICLKCSQWTTWWNEKEFQVFNTLVTTGVWIKTVTTRLVSLIMKKIKT